MALQVTEPPRLSTELHPRPTEPQVMVTEDRISGDTKHFGIKKISGNTKHFGIKKRFWVTQNFLELKRFWVTQNFLEFGDKHIELKRFRVTKHFVVKEGAGNTRDLCKFLS